MPKRKAKVRTWRSRRRTWNKFAVITCAGGLAVHDFRLEAQHHAEKLRGLGVHCEIRRVIVRSVAGKKGKVRK